MLDTEVTEAEPCCSESLEWRINLVSLKKTWMALTFSLLRIASIIWHNLFSGHKGAVPPYLLVCCQLVLGLEALRCTECDWHTPLWAIFVVENCSLEGDSRYSLSKWV